MRISWRFLLISLGIFFLIPMSTQAASLRFEEEQFQNADEIYTLVTVLLDTEEEVINAVAGEVNVSDTVQVISVEGTNRTMSHWVQQPTKTSMKTIDFSGMVVGGIQGEELELFRFIIGVRTADVRALADHPDLVQIWLEEGEAYLHDGQATQTDFIGEVFTGSIADFSSQSETDEGVDFADLYAPEPFLIEYLPIGILGDQSALVFEAQDYHSGISHYELIFLGLGEEFDAEMDYDWEHVESPYFFDAMPERASAVIVAVDRAGNKRFAEVSLLQKAEYFWLLTIIGGIIILAIILFLIYVYRKNRTSWR